MSKKKFFKKNHVMTVASWQLQWLAMADDERHGLAGTTCSAKASVCSAQVAPALFLPELPVSESAGSKTATSAAAASLTLYFLLSSAHTPSAAAATTTTRAAAPKKPRRENIKPRGPPFFKANIGLY